MKLVIASDIHGAADWCERLVAAIEAESPDRVILLGDLLYHGPRNDLPADYAPKRVIEMLNSIADQVIAVRGNCEAEVDQMVLAFPCMADHNVLVDPSAGNKTLFFTHGHVYGPGLYNSVDKWPVLPEASRWSMATRTRRSCRRSTATPASPSSTPALRASPRTAPTASASTRTAFSRIASSASSSTGPAPIPTNARREARSSRRAFCCVRP